MDKFGNHATMCLCGGLAIARHNSLTGTLGHQIAAGWNRLVSYEPRVNTTQDTSRNRTDITTTKPDTATRIHIDLSVVSATSHTALKQYGSSASPGAAADKRGADKIHFYAGLNLIPAIVETNGRVGQPLLNLIRSTFPTDPSERSTTATNFWQKWSAQLQTYNAAMIKASLGLQDPALFTA